MGVPQGKGKLTGSLSTLLTGPMQIRPRSVLKTQTLFGSCLEGRTQTPPSPTGIIC